MAFHPKISLLGALLLGGVALGLILFMMGRMTAGADLTQWLVGVAVGLAILGATVIGVLRHLPGSERFAGVLHQSSASSDEGYVSARARTELIGRSGTAASELRPAGIAESAGERVDVTTEGDWVKSGTPVVVVRAEGMRVVVRPAPQIGAGQSSREHTLTTSPGRSSWSSSSGCSSPSPSSCTSCRSGCGSVPSRRACASRSAT